MDNLDYVVLGLAECFVRDEDNQLVEQKVIEPIPSSTFLTLIEDIPSSYSRLVACRLSEIVSQSGEIQWPEEISHDAVPGNDFQERLQAAARTYEHHPEAKVWKIGQTMTLSQKSAHKRILNAINQVSETDNVKQHPHTHTTL